jgi:hypothetical protein
MLRGLGCHVRCLVQAWGPQQPLDWLYPWTVHPLAGCVPSRRSGALPVASGSACTLGGAGPWCHSRTRSWATSRLCWEYSSSSPKGTGQSAISEESRVVALLSVVSGMFVCGAKAGLCVLVRD